MTKRRILLSTGTVLAAIIIVGSCAPLDIDPTKNLNQNQVYDNEVGITAALATLYSYLPICAHNASVWGGVRGDSDSPFSIWNNPSMVTGEAECIPLRVALTARTCNGGMLAWWDYTAIRYANLAIQGITENADKFNDRKELYNTWLGEAYFCRAFMYYAMVRSYGGVPIVKEAKSYVGMTEEELYKPRNTEQECYDFIAEDLDKAYSLLGAKELAGGRANKYIAAGLKSRVMLHAADEAKNAPVQLDGLCGIPVEEATRYFKAAYEAACLAMDNGGKYGLYSKYNDGTREGMIKNYWNIFIDESASNNERMWIKEYNAGLSNPRPENWTCQQLPYHYSGVTDSGELSATVEWIELFDDVDGKPFILNVGTESNPVRYNKREELFEKAQPRLLASILVPGRDMPMKNAIFDVRKGIYESYPSGPLHESASFDETVNGMTVQGYCGCGSQMTNGNGCLVWKYVDPNPDHPQFWSGSVDWIEMRYAEILLNKAEAAVNILGETVNGHVITMDDVVTPLNMVRKRAGTTEVSSADEDLIIRERRCELAFENRIFWDLKRWRKYEEVLQNKVYSALYPYYVMDEGKYIFKIHERTEIRYTYDSKYYYAPISTSIIAKSKGAIVQNPGY